MNMPNWTADQFAQHPKRNALLGQTSHVQNQAPAPAVVEVPPQPKTEAEPADRKLSVHSFVVPVEPMGKPRMTRSDSWRKRPVVLRYREYCDTIREVAGEIPENVFSVAVISYLPMPASWSARKKEALRGTMMRQKPDCDNVLKGVMDALFEDDSSIAIATSVKVWCDEGSEQLSVHLIHL